MSDDGNACWRLICFGRHVWRRGEPGGGYASAREVLRFWLVRTFLRANADLLTPEARAELDAADPERAARFLATLSPELQRYLEGFSPLSVARDIRARLILVHGRADRAVPYTESLRLAAARPARTTVALVGVMDHVEGGGAAGWQELRDVVALWRVMYALISGD